MPIPQEFSCSCETSLGWAFGCSRRGASHLHAQKSCEDAYAVWSGSLGATPALAIAVADGHGDVRHDQSQSGAGIAVHAALEEIMLFCRIHLPEPGHVELCADFKTAFPRRITRRWREMVEEDAGRRGIGAGTADHPDDPLPVRYGTTLIVALVLSDAILLGQIGDGDLLLLRHDGVIEAPLPKDPALTGKETHSLSSKDAHLLWRTATLDRDAGGVLIAATDGVSDSFGGSDSEEFLVFIRSLVGRVRTYGIENVARAMAGWLDRYSVIASGDDMTLVYATIHPSRAPDQPVTPREEPISKPSEGW
ncbi:MAG: PP2C family serine/threonine-protein phosphatase [Methanoregula sp.]